MARFAFFQKPLYLDSTMSKNPAAMRLRAKNVIDRVLKGLSSEDKRVVLEDAMYALENDAKPRVQRRRRETVEVVTVAPIKSTEAEPELRLWQRVEMHCLAHPSGNGVHTIEDVARALGTKKPETYSAILRKSPQSDRTVNDPHFEWLGLGKFRLLEKDERRVLNS